MNLFTYYCMSDMDYSEEGDCSRYKDSKDKEITKEYFRERINITSSTRFSVPHRMLYTSAWIAQNPLIVNWLF